MQAALHSWQLRRRSKRNEAVALLFALISSTNRAQGAMQVCYFRSRSTMPSHELTSWKEIADHLGVTVRTAQKWENERGLPVRRLPGPRGMVRASVAELEAWKNSGRARASVAAESVSAQPAQHSIAGGRRALVLLVLPTVSAVLAAVWLLTRLGAPASYRLEQSQLVISDAAGRVLWRKAFPYPLESAYPMGEVDRRQLVRIIDLDGDGTREILFVQKRPLPRAEGDLLICYAENGSEKWRFVPGRTVRTATQVFRPPFTISSVHVVPMRAGSPPEIVVSASHFPEYPNQVSLLSGSGRPLREYWHSGYLEYIDTADMDADGKREIYLGGVNNARKSATLVVLDPETFQGASQEGLPEYQFQAFPVSNEKARIFFPRTCFNHKTKAYNVISGLWIRGSTVTVEVRHDPDNRTAAVMYHLDRSLNIEAVTLSDSFRAVHAELRSKKVLDHDFSAEEMASLRRLTVLVGPAGNGY